MRIINTWLLGIVLTAFAVGMAEQIIPQGRKHKAVRMVGGLLMILSLLRPLGDISLKGLSLEVGSFGSALQSQNELHREMQQKELCSIIAENLETYIWDKANQLGFECEISVDVIVQGDGIPLPDTVTIGGSFDSALASWLEEVVGIPAEKQIWQEGNL